MAWQQKGSARLFVRPTTATTAALPVAGQGMPEELVPVAVEAVENDHFR